MLFSQTVYLYENNTLQDPASHRATSLFILQFCWPDIQVFLLFHQEILHPSQALDSAEDSPLSAALYNVWHFGSDANRNF